jgi:uncharacterized protein (DUF169 family)
MSNTSDVVKNLNLDHQPVAVGFLAAPPNGLSHIDRPLPAGCGYWKHASDGHAFYTLPADHENCPVGAFTHGVTLSEAKTQELQSLVGTMVDLKYLKPEEIPSIPHRRAPTQIVAYAPLALASFAPDVIIFRGNPRQIMLVSEAARAAGVFDSGAALGRPACAMIPQTMTAGAGLASVGCIGNRVYAELGDNELYFAVPGDVMPRVLEQLEVIVTANTALEAFHRQRAAALS